MSDLNKVMLIGKVTKYLPRRSQTELAGVLVLAGTVEHTCTLAGGLGALPIKVGKSVYVEGKLIEGGMVQVTTLHQLT